MPVYSLDTIQKVAQNKHKVILLGRKVERDATNHIKLKLNYKGEVFVEIGSFHLL